MTSLAILIPMIADDADVGLLTATQQPHELARNRSELAEIVKFKFGL